MMYLFVFVATTANGTTAWGNSHIDHDGPLTEDFILHAKKDFLKHAPPDHKLTMEALTIINIIKTDEQRYATN